MISQETKDQIDKEALKEYPIHHGNYTFQGDYISEGFDANVHNRAAFIRFSTNYAEKLEEKDKEIASLNAKLFIKKNAEQELESKNSELTELKSWHDYYKERAEKGEGILKSATDIHFVPGKEGDNLLAAKDRELAQLKEIANSMADLITEWCPEKVDYKATTKIEVLTAYAELCKQNLK